MFSEGCNFPIDKLADLTPWQAAHLYLIPRREAQRRAEGKGPDPTLMSDDEMPDPSKEEFVDFYMKLGATKRRANREWDRQQAELKKQNGGS